jgi:hypothetical protein
VLTGQELRLVPGGLTRVALTKARWWSTPPRAAAPRTPGSWRAAHAEPHRKRTLLDVPPPGAGGEHGAHAGRHPDHVADALHRRRSQRAGGASHHQRHHEPFLPATAR